MNFKSVFTSITLVAGTVLVLSNSAQAASFTTNFNQNNDPKADIILKSITQDNKEISNFSFVKSANILSNTPRTDDPNSGAASTDKGDNATAPTLPEEAPRDIEIARFLGNNNLNNIVDTENSGSFKINLSFDNLIQQDNTGLDSLFFWERGMNSDLGIQAIDNTGNVIGQFLKLSRDSSNYANFTIDTMEIDSAQRVGSWGVSLKQLGVTSLAGIQVTANDKYNGPDFKVIARTAAVPEPGTVVGLGVVAGLAFLRRRQQQECRG